LISLLIAALALTAAPSPEPRAGASADSKPFNEAWLRDRAQRLAAAEYAPPSGKLPPALAKLSFDQYRDIRYRPDASVWRREKLPFELQLFHLGLFYTDPVSIYIVERGHSRLLRYNPKMFTFGANQITEPLPDTLGFAGFRIHYPLNRKDYHDELIAFLGASYFRAVGRGTNYGLSARGLAIDTAAPTGEIFPQFREFYIEKPTRHARRIVVHALLDSPSTTGAYRIEIIPGDNCEMRVTATLFPRRTVERLGLAPLTSMHLYGKNDRGNFDDYRPEVHDSDGLAIWFGNGERLWRPLQNPGRLEVSAFRANSIKGFGLLQRDRQQYHYEDLEASYERRPSAWIEPTSGFGAGSVFLVEIPSREEIHDNIVAFFTPDEKFAPGTPFRFSYRMLFGLDPVPQTPAAVTVATRIGSARRIGMAAEHQNLAPSARKFVLDFTSASPVASADGVQAVVTAGKGSVREARVQVNPFIHGYRAVFDFVPSGREPVELRCFLQRKDQALSETWSYRLSQPREDG